MKSILSYLFLFCSLAILSSCDNGLSPELSGELVYSNGFNTKSDITPWGSITFSEIAPEGGGTGSAFVSGGCVYPHSEFKLVASRSGLIQFKAWAKLEQLNGSIELTNLRTGKKISVLITENSWKKLVPEDALFVRMGDELEINMSSGGFVAGGMLVTQLDVAFLN